MKRQFAISDIHGCKHSFLALLDLIAFSKSDELFLLGDYVDRGPDSKGVIDTIWELQQTGYSVQCLMGNHEEIVLSEWDYEKRMRLSSSAVDPRFLESFDAKRSVDIPVEYYEWMQQLAPYIEIPGFILVHAGLDFSDLEQIMVPQRAMLWIRNWYTSIDYEWLGERVIVHGHTPRHWRDIRTQFNQLQQLRVLDIDAGCSTIGYDGQLCAFDMSNFAIHFQRRVDF
jgi:serine/threonine protein phosphatase 1